MTCAAAALSSSDPGGEAALQPLNLWPSAIDRLSARPVSNAPTTAEQSSLTEVFSPGTRAVNLIVAAPRASDVTLDDALRRFVGLLRLNPHPHANHETADQRRCVLIQLHGPATAVDRAVDCFRSTGDVVTHNFKRPFAPRARLGAGKQPKPLQQHPGDQSASVQGQRPPGETGEYTIDGRNCI